MEFKELVELKNVKKAKQPKFLRQDAHKKDKLVNKWRQPKGKDSKMRKKKGSKRRMPSMGFSSPRLVRGLNRQGLKEINVKNLNDLTGIDNAKEIVLVGNVGKKKKVEILNKCQELKLNVANVKDIVKYLDEVKKAIDEKKTKVAEIKKKKEEKEKKVAKKDKKEEKKEVKQEATEEVKQETKKGEKSDKIKVLEKRQ